MHWQKSDSHRGGAAEEGPALTQTGSAGTAPSRGDRGRRLSVKTGDHEERGLKRNSLYGDMSLLAFLRIDEKIDTTLENYVKNNKLQPNAVTSAPSLASAVFVRVNPNPNKQGNMSVSEPTQGWM